MKAWSRIVGLGLLCSFVACQEKEAFRLHDNPATDLKGDLPPLGRSLFDALTMQEVSPGVYEQQVPFPFTELRKRIESQASTPALVTLIPKGRSLQRNASSEPFKFPRVVLAVPSEPIGAQHLLKDRLYIGYVESVAQLEVISFNPTAGRFEFQVVEGYGPGLKPDVRYANRSFCLSCHQNEAPIFSLPSWDETVANAAIADRVIKARGASSYLNIPIKQFSNIPNEIDNSTDRANSLHPYQIIWRDGCRRTTAAATRQCRRLVLEMALTYAWDGDLPQSMMDAFISLAQPAWAEWLPQGLSLVSPDIPNFFGETTVPAAFDPLTDRTQKPWQQWLWDDGGAFRSVFGILENLQDKDLAWLQAHADAREAIRQQLIAWESQVNSPLGQVAFDRCSWLVPLTQAVAPQAALSCPLQDHPAWPVPRSTGGATGEVGHDLAYFMRYCGRCHQSGPRPFLAGTTEFEILQNLRKNAGQHRARLEWEKNPERSMPPSGSKERTQLESTPNDRSEMLRLLGEWSS